MFYTQGYFHVSHLRAPLSKSHPSKTTTAIKAVTFQPTPFIDRKKKTYDDEEAEEEELDEELDVWEDNGANFWAGSVAHDGIVSIFHKPTKHTP